MHELSLALGICDAVRAHLPEGARAVSVTVECGPLAGVVPEALEHCFGAVAESEGLAGARLDLLVPGARARCPACSAEFEVTSMWGSCPECGHMPVTVVGGRDLTVKEIEVEDV